MTMAPARADLAQSPVGWDSSAWRPRCALVLVMTCAALAGPIGYAGQNAYAALVGVCGVVSLPMVSLRRAPLIGMAILMALALWAVVSMSWSPYTPMQAHLGHYKQVEGLTAIKLVLQTLLYGAFVVLARETPERWARRILLAVTFGLGLITALMVIDALSGLAVYKALDLSVHAATRPDFLQRNAGRGCFSVAVLFWPVAVWLKREGWLAAAIVLGAGLIVASIGLHVDSPVVALGLGGLVLVLVQRLGRPAIWALLAATLLYFALTPAFFAVVGPRLPHFHTDHGIAKASWGVRLDIWRFAGGKILERPWQGWGIDASRVWPEVEMHPHNAVLQLWLELGVVGAALGALFWVYVWARIGAAARANRADAGVFAAVAAAYLSIGGMSFGVWQEWWLALGVIAVIVCDTLVKVAVKPSGRTSEPTPHRQDGARGEFMISVFRLTPAAVGGVGSSGE